jgi:hypothetical protein
MGATNPGAGFVQYGISPACSATNAGGLRMGACWGCVCECASQRVLCAGCADCPAGRVATTVRQVERRVPLRTPALTNKGDLTNQNVYARNYSLLRAYHPGAQVVVRTRELTAPGDLSQAYSSRAGAR